jgi:serine/threonine protein kinase
MDTGQHPVSSRQFRFVECLGRGGFGEVYRASMTDRGGVRTEVAVKVLHADVDPHSQAVHRLRDEAHVLAALRHPAIVKVLDLVLLDGRVALVTEFVDGQDLSALVRATPPIPVRPLIDVVGQVASALSAAWETPGEGGEPLGLVHRDVKPHNIRIGRHGEVKLLDFGIARGHGIQRLAHTTNDSVVGSWQYMAPEAFAGSTGPASDLFSLGCVLYEGVAGKRVWAGLDPHEQFGLVHAPDRLRAHLAAVVAALPPEVPPGVRELCAALLSPDPAERPSARVVVARCEDLVERLPGAPLRRWCTGRAWPDTPARHGEFDGRQIVEGALTDDSLSAPRSLAQRPPPRAALAPHPPDEGRVDTLERTAPRPSGRAWAMAASGVAGLVSGVGALTALFVLAIGWFFWQRATPATPPPAPVAVAAPRPRPADPAPPTPVAAPAPQHAPTPAADPAPPTPAPPTAPVAGATGRVDLDERNRVRVRAARDGVVSPLPGDLQPGSWTIEADFGGGWTRAGAVTVGAGQRRVVLCNGLLRKCTAP